MSSKLRNRQHTVNETDGPPARTPAGDALSALAVQVLRLGGLLGAAGDALARPAGQSTARWRVLAAVEEAPRTVAEVARRLGLARQSVQRVADLLAADGLVSYEPDPADRRADRLRLSGEGLRALRAIQAAQRAWADALGARLGEGELRAAAAVLERLAASLAADAE